MALVTGRGGVNGGLGFEAPRILTLAWCRWFHAEGRRRADPRVAAVPLAVAWIPCMLAPPATVPRKQLPDGRLRVSIAVLALAACLLIDDRRGRWQWKLFVALSLTMAIAFGKLAAFVPGSASLCALAAVMLAVAVCSPERPMLTAAANVAAVMALPVEASMLPRMAGRSSHARFQVRASRIALMFGPAALMWLFVAVVGLRWRRRRSGRGLRAAQAVWIDRYLDRAAVSDLRAAKFPRHRGHGGLSLIAFADPAAWSADGAPRARRLSCSPRAVIVYAITVSSDALRRSHLDFSHLCGCFCAESGAIASSRAACGGGYPPACFSPSSRSAHSARLTSRHILSIGIRTTCIAEARQCSTTSYGSTGFPASSVWRWRCGFSRCPSNLRLRSRTRRTHQPKGRTSRSFVPRDGGNSL